MITRFLKSFLSSQKISTFLLYLCLSFQVKISEYLLIVYFILSLKWAFTFFIYPITFFLQLWISYLGFSEINCLFYCKTSKVAYCWLKEVLTMYGEGNGNPLQYSCLENKSQKKQPLEKNSSMMLTEKGYVLKNKFPKYMDTHESKGERKLPPIIEKYIDKGAKI